MNRFKKTYRECLCLVSSGGFVAGCIYPIVGWNNGLHVITEDKTVNHWIICFIMGAVILLKTNMG